MVDIELAYDAFLRAIKQNTDTAHVLLLGAGASISSGVQSAADCIWEWKKEIFISKYPNLTNQYKEFKTEAVKNSIQKWLDNEGTYLPLNHPDEYTTYAELAYPIDDTRRKYFENICRNKEPYVGYKILCYLAKSELFKVVFTTNFDGLTVKAAYQSDITPIEITLESSERVYRPVSKNELLCISLHGDYKYGPLKNTNKELDAQHGDFVKALIHHLNDKHLIVFGYSGRDKSLMNALKEAYKAKGSGMLFWCGYGTYISDEVKEIIEEVRQANRRAFYIPTDGFDTTMIHLSKNCYSHDQIFQTSLQNLLKTSDKSEWLKTPFTMAVKHTNNLLRSNLFPIVFPKEVFQFEIKIDEGEKEWDVVKSLIKDSDIVAGSIRKIVYSLATSSDLHNVFKGRIIGDVQRTSVLVEEIKNGTMMKNIFLKAIIKSLCKNFGLLNNGFNKIWKETDKKSLRAYGKNYQVFEAIKIGLFFDHNHKFGYLSIKPTFWSEGFDELEFDVKLEIARVYYKDLLKMQPNFILNNIIEKWRGVFFSGGKYEFEYPIHSGSGFKFSISPETMYVSIMKAHTTQGISLPNNFNRKSILHNGIQYPEPLLNFTTIPNNQIVQDFHPMHGLTHNKPYDYSLNGNVFDPEINIGIICPNTFGHKVVNFLNRLNTAVSAGGENPDFLLDYPGFLAAYGIPLKIPDFKSGLWQNYSLPNNQSDLKTISLSLLSSVKGRIDVLECINKKLVLIIFIPTAWNDFTKTDDGQEKFDLHDHIKAYAAQKGLATQFIQEETLTDPSICQVNWWLSLSFYVKSLRTPWILSGLDSETAFVGIGYSVNHKSKNERVVLGCSHVYNSNGQGLKYKLSKVEDCVYDKKNNPFLSYQDAYKFGVSIREMFFNAMGDLPKRVVVHKRTPFKKDEARGIIDSLKKTGINDIDLIEINFEEEARFLGMTVKNGQVQAHLFPLSRGTCFLLDSTTALLWTHGIVQSIKENYRSYYLGGKNIPVPLKIKKHYGSSNISTIATEILGLTKMNWNSFDLYSKLPATIQTSNEIARIGWLLNRFEGRIYDYRNFM